MLSLIFFASVHVTSVSPITESMLDQTSWAAAKKRGSKHGTRSSGTVKPNPAIAVIPADVRNFTQRRDLCDHLRGEDSYDPQRAEELEEGMVKNCSGTDKELRDLRKKYAKNPEIKAKLAKYQSEIEDGPAEDN